MPANVPSSKPPPMAGRPTRGEMAERLLWLMVLRAAVITILLGATLALNYQSFEDLRQPSSLILLGTVVATYGLTILYGVWLRLRRALSLLAKLQFFLDLVIWTVLVYTTGGITSGFTFLYHMSVILSAVIFGQKGAMIVAGLSSILLLLLEGFMFVGLVPPLSDQLTMAPVELGEFFYYGGANVTALLLMAGLAGNLAGRIEVTGAGLERERRRRADLKAREEDIVRSLTSGLITTDPSLVIRSINPAALNILGAEASRVIGSGLDAFLPEAAEAASAEKKGLPFLGRGHARTGEGTLVPVEFNISFLRDAAGVLVGYIVVFQDVSVIAEMEDKLEQARHLSALGELAASLAHEIRNPLGSISGVMEMISDDATLSGDNRKLVDLAGKELVRINALVEQMLSHARPRTIEIAKVDLSELAGEVVRAFREGGGKNTLDIVAEIEPGIEVWAEASQIKQVLWNLLLNVSQHAGDDVRVVVRLEREGADDVRIEVEDDGRGIEPKDLERIFDPFYSTKKRGVGLGLSLSKRIVETHGGRLDVESAPGRGARFWMILPVSPQRSSDGSRPSMPPS